MELGPLSWVVELGPLSWVVELGPLSWAEEWVEEPVPLSGPLSVLKGTHSSRK